VLSVRAGCSGSLGGFVFGLKNEANAAADFFVASWALTSFSETSGCAAASFGGRPGPRFSTTGIGSF
jgi:hypothetical protein